MPWWLLFIGIMAVGTLAVLGAVVLVSAVYYLRENKSMRRRVPKQELVLPTSDD